MASAASSMIRTLGRLPMPLFGTAAAATLFAKNGARKLPPLVGWAFPAVVGGMWFIWPAVDEEWKTSIGLGKSAPVEEEPAEAPKLDEAALAKVEVAHKVDAVVVTAEDKAVSAEIQSGNFSTLEKDWDEFLVKAIKPGEDDDEDEDEDEEEEEEDEE